MMHPLTRTIPATPTEQTILIVDQDQDFLDWATRHLAAKGLRILRCTDAGKALLVLQKTPVEFVLVGVLLTLVTLSVLQVAFALHIRTTLIDAAAEGARFAALADSSLPAGIERSRELITAALGESYAQSISAGTGAFGGHPVRGAL